MTEETLKFWEAHSDAGGRELTAEIRRSWARIAELEKVCTEANRAHRGLMQILEARVAELEAALYRVASSADTDRDAAMARGVLG